MLCFFFFLFIVWVMCVAAKGMQDKRAPTGPFLVVGAGLCSQLGVIFWRVLARGEDGCWEAFRCMFVCILACRRVAAGAGTLSHPYF